MKKKIKVSKKSKLNNKIFKDVIIENSNLKFECAKCDGKGDIKCDTCNGGGTISCQLCVGKGKRKTYETCPDCNGSGKKRFRVFKDTCKKCNGSGHIYKWYDCDNCDATGKMKCRKCRGKKRLFCEDCAGTGKIPLKKCYGLYGFIDENKCSHCDKMFISACKKRKVQILKKLIYQCPYCAHIMTSNINKKKCPNCKLIIPLKYISNEIDMIIMDIK